MMRTQGDQEMDDQQVFAFGTCVQQPEDEHGRCLITNSAGEEGQEILRIERIHPSNPHLVH
jgi:hypothetical protein